MSFGSKIMATFGCCICGKKKVSRDQGRCLSPSNLRVLVVGLFLKDHIDKPLATAMLTAKKQKPICTHHVVNIAMFLEGFQRGIPYAHHRPSHEDCLEFQANKTSVPKLPWKKGMHSATMAVCSFLEIAKLTESAVKDFIMAAKSPEAVEETSVSDSEDESTSEQSGDLEANDSSLKSELTSLMTSSGSVPNVILSSSYAAVTSSGVPIKLLVKKNVSNEQATSSRPLTPSDDRMTSSPAALTLSDALVASCCVPTTPSADVMTSSDVPMTSSAAMTSLPSTSFHSGLFGTSMMSSAATKYVVVRLSDDESLMDFIDTLDSKCLPYSVCSSATSLEAPSENGMESMWESQAQTDFPSQGSTAVPITSYQPTDGPATGTAEIKSDGPILNIAELLGTASPSGSGETEGDDMGIDSPCTPQSLAEFRRVMNTRSVKNIKRYRRQLCHICNKTFIVPFYRSKMCHAAIHSGVRRYCCDFCPKRAVHQLTMRQHIRVHHSKQCKGAGNMLVGYKDDMNEKALATLIEWTERCFPEPYQ